MALTVSDAEAMLRDLFAPWVQALALEVEAVGADSATLRMPYSDRLTRVGGIVCGQSLMALADTATVIAVTAAMGGFCEMATVDQTTSFLRPVKAADTLATARVLKLGRSLAFIGIEIRPAGSDELAVNATATYALAPG